MNATRAREHSPASVMPLPWGRWSLRAVALIWLGVMIALPVAVLLEHGLREGVVRFWAEITNPIALAAVRLTISAAAVMTLINAVMGTLTAYVLVDRKSTRLNSSHLGISYAVFC